MCALHSLQSRIVRRAAKARTSGQTRGPGAAADEEAAKEGAGQEHEGLRALDEGPLPPAVAEARLKVKRRLEQEYATGEGKQLRPARVSMGSAHNIEEI